MIDWPVEREGGDEEEEEEADFSALEEDGWIDMDKFLVSHPSTHLPTHSHPTAELIRTACFPSIFLYIQ